ncbi:uncharacterized protein LOC122636008 isoform X1 [Vespula pensylvanica]|uniref:uncharacterized protein LOC122636008 isoform X1 n=1 Tax=Vespula pensylvanica TaxID=30213 RepID=UPI001CBA553B|nr:uncharacterized protein LOC122636008 isoform X1 [Vespula pensylvanica]
MSIELQVNNFKKENERGQEEDIVVRNKRSLSYSMKIPYYILRVIGVWPLRTDASVIDRFASYSMKCMCYFFFAFILIPGFLRIFLIEKSTQQKLKIFGPLCSCSTNAMKYSILLMHREKIRTCLKHIREDWTKIILQEDHELMMSQARIGRILSTMSICFIYGAGIFYRTFLPLSKGSVVVGNHTIRPLACPSYFVLFDEQKSPAYELVFFGQFLGGFTVYTVGSGVCGLAAFFIMHVCGQLGILMRKMNDIVEGNYSIEKNPKIRIAEVIRHQIRTRSFVKEVEEILQYPCMAEIMGCTSLVCLVLYYLVMEWEDSDATGLITFVLLFVSFAFNMFIFCYIGELLSEQGAKVGLTSSTLNWHCLPVKDMKCLIPVIIMSNYPLKIVAGKLMDMSLSNFNNVSTTINRCLARKKINECFIFSRLSKRL